MKSLRHKKLFEHYTKIFRREPAFSLRPNKNLLDDGVNHISTLVFCPDERLPFWKLCTVGASDCLMPQRDIGLGRKANRRNEYMMFVAPNVDISQSSTEWLQLNALLWLTAEYAYKSKENITVSDTLEISAQGKYCGTLLLLPEVLESAEATKCYISAKKFISVFQVMPLTRELMEEKSARGQEGVNWLMEQFYTHDDDYKLITSNPLVAI